MKLIIVESPTKARTISQFLGKAYKVESSYGHVRDLPKSKLGIDVASGFQPTYVILPKAKERIAALKKLAEQAPEIILATDEDREGEAIAWHLVQALELEGSKIEVRRSKRKKTSSITSNIEHRTVQRIVFHEITKEAIQEALEHPREIDIRLVDAQQARRVLDRLVGYELSPFLWRKVRFGLSAGRVQSVAVRVVVEREREIQNFQKEEYWTIEGEFSKQHDQSTFPAKLFAIDGKSLEKMAITTETTARSIVAALHNAHYQVKEISSKIVSRSPAPPFTTSTLQQEASRKLGFSAKQTMLLAQQLYENGFITYMRTDSVNLSNQSLAQARQVIGQRFGTKYALDQPRRFLTKTKGAQEAHEAIRPSDLSKSAGEVTFGEKKHQRLYDLIWKRTLASQMKEAVFEQTAVDIETPDAKYMFRANGQVIQFDGFLKIYAGGRNQAEKETEALLPKLEQDEALEAKEILPVQHFTEPPPRYTDATLVKTLEAAGVGRPSTYAPILSTIQDRGYVEKIEKRYQPTEIGIVVNDLLVEHFPEIVDINFTSHIEEELDAIAEGTIAWTAVAGEFYGPFKQHLIEKEAGVGKYTEASTTPCPHCGEMMIVKFGRFGKFLACPDPESKVTLPTPKEAANIQSLKETTKDEKCPLCGKPMEIKRGRFGFFLGCGDYPACKGILKILKKIGFKCPNCLAATDRKNSPGDLIEKKARLRKNFFYGCSRYPDCTFIANKKPESQEELDALFEQWSHRDLQGVKKSRSKKAGKKKATNNKKSLIPKL